MKKITNKDYEDLIQYRKDLQNGRLFTRNLLEYIVRTSNYDAKKIGEYFLDIYNQKGENK